MSLFFKQIDFRERIIKQQQIHHTLNEIGVKDHQNWWFTISTNSIFATLYWWFYPPLALHQKLVYFLFHHY